MLKARCRCGAILTFSPSPVGYKTVCDSCGSVVRLRGAEEAIKKIRKRREKKAARKGARDSISLRCTCEHVFTVTERRAGRDVRCPQCRRRLRVPDPERLAPDESRAEVIAATEEITKMSGDVKIGSADEREAPAQADAPPSREKVGRVVRGPAVLPPSEKAPDLDLDDLPLLADDDDQDKFFDRTGFSDLLEQAVDGKGDELGFRCPACRSEIPRSSARCPECNVPLRFQDPSES